MSQQICVCYFFITFMLTNFIQIICLLVMSRFVYTGIFNSVENCSECNRSVNKGNAGYKGRVNVYNNRGVSIGYVCERCRFKTKDAATKVGLISNGVGGVCVPCIWCNTCSVFVGLYMVVVKRWGCLCPCQMCCVLQICIRKTPRNS
jgi:hypothetical protein